MQRRILLASLVALAASNAVAADVKHGRDLAERWCASCHAVSLEPPRVATEAPAFETVARKQDLDAAALAWFLMDPHPKMPNMALTRSEAADLAAYIKSLAK